MISTRKLFEKLRKNPTSENYQAFYRKINRKFKLTESKNRFYLPRPEEINDNSIANILQYPLEEFFLRAHEMKLHFNKSAEIIWHNKIPLYSIREKDKIIFENPLVGKIQSWHNLEFAEYAKHINGSSQASQFIKGFRKDVEIEVFNKGRGYLDNRIGGENRIYLVYEFEEVIGDSKGEKSNFVKLQADRRPNNSGYFTKIHGYPITRLEYLKELKKLENKVI